MNVYHLIVDKVEPPTSKEHRGSIRGRGSHIASVRLQSVISPTDLIGIIQDCDIVVNDSLISARKRLKYSVEEFIHILEQRAYVFWG